MESYWAAFIGAFSAFLFMRLADVSNKIYERQVRNYNALVKLEHFCLEKVDDSAVNVLTVDGFCSCLQESVQKNQFIFYRNKFQRIDFDEALLLDMRNLAFMNQVLSFKVCLRRLNQDMDMINTTYNGICEGVINKNIDQVTYIENMKSILVDLIEFKKFLLDIENQFVVIAAGTRVLMRREKPLFTRFLYMLYSEKAINKNFQEEVEIEVKLICSERAQVSLRSKEEIDRIKNMHSNE